MARPIVSLVHSVLLVFVLCLIPACTAKDEITGLSQLRGKVFAVPTGTVADKLVLSRFPQARFQYYNSVLDASMAVKAGRVDAAAYDEPILRNIAAKNPGLMVLPDMITKDTYGFAVRMDDRYLKTAIDGVVAELHRNGTYAAMERRWLPRTGNPGPMPQIPSGDAAGVVKLGTAAITEPFAYVDDSRDVVGFDIELARYVAQKLGRKLEVVNMDFGALIPALLSGKVDMIAACITITDERAQKVLFSEPYYDGGIAALVREPVRR